MKKIKRVFDESEIENFMSPMHQTVWKMISWNQNYKAHIRQFLAFQILKIATNNGSIDYAEMKIAIDEIADQCANNHVYVDHVMARWLECRAVMLSGQPYEEAQLNSNGDSWRRYACCVLMEAEKSIEELISLATMEVPDPHLMEKFLIDEDSIIQRARKIYMKNKPVAAPENVQEKVSHPPVEQYYEPLQPMYAAAL